MPELQPRQPQELAHGAGQARLRHAQAFAGVRQAVAHEQGDPERARHALDAGAEATDAGSRVGRALAAGFWHVAAMARDGDDAASGHRSVIENALADAESVPPDPMLRDLADRLRRKLAQVDRRHGRGAQ